MNKITFLARVISNTHINNKLLRKCSSLAKSIETNKLTSTNQISEKLRVIATNKIPEEIDFENEINAMKIADQQSILEPCTEDVSHIAPYFQPTFNFAAYINKSETLQKLVHLGVDLHKIEKKKAAPEYLMKLDFEKDMKKHIFFLHDLGVSPDELGEYLTRNPYIFQEDLDNLAVRINYLQSKQFSDVMITRIVTKNPYWLMFSTKRIDSRLGHFQKTFSLTGKEIRLLTTKQPKLITYKLEHVNLNTFSVKEEMGFDNEQMKTLLLGLPKLWMMSQNSILKRFDYIHNTMKISHERILQMPKVLTSRKFRINQRHQYLEKLGKAQYDPTKENYVSLEQFVKGTDSEFCANIAKTSVQAYNTFLKTL